MKYKVIEHLTYVYSVVVEADNKEEAWSKAMEGGLMSKFGKLDDMYTTKNEVEEASDEEMTIEELRECNDATLKEKLCPDHDMEFYEFNEDGRYYHGYECSTCGMIQTG